MPRRRATTFFVGLVSENLGLKALSLTIAIALFLLTHGGDVVQRSVSVDLSLILPAASEGRTLVGTIPDHVRLTLRGPENVLDNVARETIPPVRLSVRSSESRRTIEPSLFELPSGVTIVGIEPAALNLNWVRLIERRVPVSAQLVGDPAEGLEQRAGTHTEPASIVLRGPEPALRGLQRVETLPIDLSTQPVGRHALRVALEDPPVGATWMDTGEVVVHFDIEPRLEERTLRRVAVAVVGENVHVALRPSTVDIVLKGPQRAIDSLDAEHVVPYVEPGALPSEPRRVGIRGLPANVETVRIDPPEVLVQQQRGR